MSGNRATLIVELTSDEKRLLDGFRKAAAADDDLRAGLNKTGTAAESNSRRIVSAMTQAGRDWKKGLSTHEKDSNAAFQRMSKYAVTEIAAIGAAYLGVQQTFQAISGRIQEHQATLRQSADSQKDLATYQTEASKNLSAFPRATQQDLLTRLVPKIAKDAVVSDLGAITQALGDTASAGATEAQIREILPIAAGLNRLTPDQMSETSAAIMDSMRASGEQNARLNMAEILLTGTQSRVVNPGKLVRNLAPVKIAAAEAVPEEFRAEAARQGSSLFAAMTKSGADSQGDASQTAAIQFMASMRSFFKDIGKDATAAKKELEELEQNDPISAGQRLRLKQLSANEAASNRNNLQIEKVNARLQEIETAKRSGTLDTDTNRTLGYEQQDLRRRLTELRKVEFTERDAAELADLRDSTNRADRQYQKRIAELRGTIAAADIKGFEGKAPILPFDQLKAIQSNPQLQAAFGNLSFGEQRFKSANEQLIRGGTAFLDAQGTYDLLNRKGRDTSIVDSLLSQTEFLTPQQETAFIRAKSEVGRAIRLNFDSYGGQLGQQREDLATVLKENQPDGFLNGFQAYYDEVGVSNGLGLSGSTPTEESVSAITKLARRRSLILEGGVSKLEQSSLQNIDNEIEARFLQLNSSTSLQEDPQTLERLNKRLSFYGSRIRSGNTSETYNADLNTAVDNREIFLRLEQTMNDLVELQRQQLDASNQTAKSTEQTAKNTKQTTRPSSAQREAAAASNNRRGR